MTMLDAALAALGGLLDPSMLLLLLVGVVAGLLLGVIPGMGGTGSVAVLLPVIFIFEPHQALALIIGAVAVIHTSDTVSAVLLGIPGSASSSVSLMDGHPMAKQGQAARALAIAFVSSTIGGLIGVFGLTLAINVAEPLVLFFGSPELFMLTALGVAMAALLSRGNVLKGLLAGLFGLLLGQIGVAPNAADYRYTFGSLFLTEGLGIVAVALGIFGLAEVLAFVARKTSIASKTGLGSGWLQGVGDALRNLVHIVRGSLVGIWMGILPGIGATAGAWMAYGQTVATAKDKRKFGKGDPRGIAAPDGASNSISAGELIPTLLFGIPGSAAAALLLSALLVFGVQPGPTILSDHLDLVYTIVWSFALAAMVGALFCFLAAPLLARLTFVRFPVIAAGLIVVMFVSGFQANQQFAVLQVMLLLGVLGWVMKAADYPRAPFLIGFVLSVPLERYYFLTDSLYEPGEWLTKPGVVVIASIILLPLLWRGAKLLVKRARGGERVTRTASATVGGTSGELAVPAGEGSLGTGPGGDAEPWESAQAAATTAAMRGKDSSAEAFRDTALPLVFAIVLLAVFAGGLSLAQDFSEKARLAPQLVTITGCALALAAVVREVLHWRATRGQDKGREWRDELRWCGYALVWLLALLALAWMLGMFLAAAIFASVFLWRVADMRWRGILLYTVFLLAALYGLAAYVGIDLPIGWFTPGFVP
jgi:putative tricarboxylic transport membrane protein